MTVDTRLTSGKQTDREKMGKKGIFVLGRSPRATNGQYHVLVHANLGTLQNIVLNFEFQAFLKELDDQRIG